MEAYRRIAVLTAQDLRFHRDVLRGTRAYVLEKPDWFVYKGRAEMRVMASVRHWQPQGLITHLDSRDVARAVTRLRKPLVDTACILPDLKVAAVNVDNRAVGRLAAEYLLARKFTHFGFFGTHAALFSRLREEGFRDELAKHGYAVSSCLGEYLPPAATWIGWREMDRAIGHWLRRLPKPAAILASNDVAASRLADLCWHLGVSIPTQVAVLGVDDDELECLLTALPLSSVAIPGQRVGYEAAKLLDRMMSGEPAPKTPLLLPPLGVVTRQSTDTMAVGDPTVMAALTYIRQRAALRITVGGVAEDIGCSRRELERRFRRILGRSVLGEIRAVRLERAKEMLGSTDLAMPDIASHCGFSTPQRFAVVFRQLTGMTATAYRRQARIRSD